MTAKQEYDTSAKALGEGMLEYLKGKENDTVWMISVDIEAALRHCLPPDVAKSVIVTDGSLPRGRGYRALNVRYNGDAAKNAIVGFVDVTRKVVGKAKSIGGGAKNVYGYKAIKFSYAFGAKDFEEAVSKAEGKAIADREREKADLDRYAKAYEWLKEAGYAADGYEAMDFLENAAKAGYRLHNSGKLGEIFGK